MRTGAIVARFQVATLHSGHLHLINSILAKVDKLVILLGEPGLPNPRNPLSFDIRKEMILQSFPDKDITFYQIRDHKEDHIWSQNLDLHLSNHENVTLFGSRDSFRKYYKGNLPYEEIPELEGFTGTDAREKILAMAYENMNCEAFRMGVIYGFNQRTDYQSNDLK
jgi:hypothetical protein